MCLLTATGIKPHDNKIIKKTQVSQNNFKANLQE